MESTKKMKTDKLQIFLKAIYAGFMIGIGGMIYLSMENKVIGALLFSFGLLTIVTQGFFLYTGKVGFIKSFQEILDMLVVIAGNFVGTFIAACLSRAAGLPISSLELAAKKLDNSVLHIFILSILCGVMMYLAIDNHKRGKGLLFIIAPVMIFILAGFEHSIADMFYFHLAACYTPKAFGYLAVMLLGNGIGAKVFDLKELL